MREQTWTGLGPGPEIDNLRMNKEVLRLRIKDL